VVTAGIIILQIYHFSINMFDEFAEQKVNKIMIFFSEHNSHDENCGVKVLLTVASAGTSQSSV